MIYFKNPETGDVYAYESAEDAAQHAPEVLVEMTEAEVDAHLDPAPVQLTRDQVEALRLRAYADPLTGSDRYFAEAQRESLLGNTEAADAARDMGLARFAEIQADYPWP